MKILIADDEYLARTSLKSMLGEMELPIDCIIEATNGEEMVALVQENLPDLAFIDIRMPRLNGLEAIRKGRFASPQTKWFILTGFPEFDYAKEAIQLGVSDYLLKPVNPEVLSRALNDFLGDYRRRISAQNKYFERDLMALQYGLTTLEFDEIGSHFKRSRFKGAILIFDSHLAEKTKASHQFKFGHALREQIEVHSTTHNRLALIILPSGELASIGAWIPHKDCQADAEIRQYFKDISYAASAFSDQDFAITVLEGGECTGYSSLHGQLERLGQISSLRAICGIGQTLHYRVLHEEAAKQGWLALSSQIALICRSYHEKHYFNYMTALQSLEHLVKCFNFDENRHLKITVSDFFQRSINCILPVNDHPASWIEALRHHGEGLLNEKSGEEIPGVDIIRQVLHFIDENYTQDIGIGIIAEQIYITPNYLSTLFHKRTGTNFMSYLKNVRLLKAKELLNDPNIQIQQVAERVGYSSPRHFARLFAEQYGRLPSEYRDRLKEH